MTLIDFLNHLLQEERKHGATNRQMADRAGISQQHMNCILNGKRDLGGVSFEVMMRLFPKLERILIENLHIQDTHSQAITGNGNIVANHNSTATANYPSTALLDAALDYVLEDPELCEKCRMAAIRCIRKAAKEKP